MRNGTHDGTPGAKNGQNGNYLFELMAGLMDRAGGPEGRPHMTTGSRPITITGWPQGVRPRSLNSDQCELPDLPEIGLEHPVPSPVSISRTDLQLNVQRSGATGTFGLAKRSWFNHARYDVMNRVVSANDPGSDLKCPDWYDPGPPVENPPPKVDPCPGIAKQIRDTIPGVGMPSGKSLFRRVVEQIAGDPDRFVGHQNQIDNYRNRLKDLRSDWRGNDCDPPDDPPYGTNYLIQETSAKVLRKYQKKYQQYTADLAAIIACVATGAIFAQVPSLITSLSGYLESIGGSWELLLAVP